jgi:hypothetical protein
MYRYKITIMHGGGGGGGVCCYSYHDHAAR